MYFCSTCWLSGGPISEVNHWANNHMYNVSAYWNLRNISGNRPTMEFILLPISSSLLIYTEETPILLCSNRSSEIRYWCNKVTYHGYSCKISQTLCEALSWQYMPPAKLNISLFNSGNRQFIITFNHHKMCVCDSLHGELETVYVIGYW